MDRGRLESPGNSGWGGQPMRCSLNGEGMVVVRLDSGVTRVSYCHLRQVRRSGQACRFSSQCLFVKTVHGY